MSTGPPINPRSPWVLRVPRDHAHLLAPLRQFPGLQVAESGPSLWLRGQEFPGPLARALSMVPGATRFDPLGDEQLRPVGKRIPTERLPPLDWLPFLTWFEVTLPLAAMPGGEPPKAALRLVRSEEMRTAELLLTQFSLWAAFASGASQVRLERLAFAASHDGDVLVRGVPLPPLPGERYVIQDGVAVPAGYVWWPALRPDVVRQWLRVPVGGVALWRADGSVTQVQAEQWVGATRSAVAATRTSLGTRP